MTDDAGSGPSGDVDEPAPSLSERLQTGSGRFASRWRFRSGTFDRAVARSRLAGAGRRCRAVVDDSRIVRWLTREPDPEVIVIDLAETRTLGPVLAAIDGLARGLATPWGSSRVRDGLGRAVRALERNAVPAASGVLLGVVVGTAVLGDVGGDPLVLLSLAVAGLAALLGLAVDRSRVALAGSRFRNACAALLAPPEDPPAGDRTG